jgi:tRNA pseudouridine55 synthase
VGRRRRDPDVSGVLVVDKPAGMTSHDVVARARRALGIRRVGHTGTLDPAATGVLVCAVGRATRLVQFMQRGPKTYAATLVLGRETDSQDADGTIVAEADASAVTEADVCAALGAFVGDIEQVPPMVSAVRVDGERLHERARRGEVVEREARSVTVHDLVLDQFVPGSLATVSLLVTCSAGTYVRTLAHDLGQRLGVGGSLTALRRLATGGFDLEDALGLDEVEALGEERTLRDRLLPPQDALRLLASTTVTDDVRDDLVHGRSMDAVGIEGPYAVHDAAGRLIGVYEDHDGAARPSTVMLRPEDLATG